MSKPPSRIGTMPFSAASDATEPWRTPLSQPPGTACSCAGSSRVGGDSSCASGSLYHSSIIVPSARRPGIVSPIELSLLSVKCAVPSASTVRFVTASRAIFVPPPFGSSLPESGGTYGGGRSSRSRIFAIASIGTMIGFDFTVDGDVDGDGDGDDGDSVPREDRDPID